MEYDQKDRDQDHQSEKLMRQNLIDLIRDPMTALIAVPDGILDNRRNKIVPGKYLSVWAGFVTGLVVNIRYDGRRAFDLSNLCRQFVDPAAALYIHCDNRSFEQNREHFDIDLVLLIFKNIDHRQCDDDGNAEFEKLRDEVEIAFEIGRIDYCDDNVGLWQTGLVARNNVAGDLFIERCRVETVQARNVDEICGLAVNGPRSFLAFDSDAGVICDLLFEAGESVKEGRLAGVRVTGKSDGQLRISFVLHSLNRKARTKLRSNQLRCDASRGYSREPALRSDRQMERPLRPERQRRAPRPFPSDAARQARRH